MKFRERNMAMAYLWFFLSFALLYALLFKKDSVVDVATSMIIVGVFTGYHKKMLMDDWMYWFVAISITMAMAGSLYLFSNFMVLWFGYDKFLHTITSFTGGIIVSSFLIRKYSLRKTLVFFTFVVFIIMGISAILEVMEFVGNNYIGIGHPSSAYFASDDGLPIVSDLQRYDTYFDLIFNIFGSTMGCFFYAVVSRREKPERG